MQTLLNNTRGLTLILSLNWDRIIYLTTILAALGAGAWVGAH